jgi:hypothetical protein
VRILQSAILISALIIGTSASASQTGQGVLDPMQLEQKAEQVNAVALIEKIMKEPDPTSRYIGMASYLKAKGPWVTLSGGGLVARIHIVSYLLQQGYESDAVALLLNRDVEGWLSYRFQSGVANDFMFALDGGYLDYMDTLFKSSPGGLNTPFTLTLSGDKVSPLSMLASDKYKDKVFYESVIRKMLKYGANPHQEMPNGLSPMLVASSVNNMKFIKIVQAYLAEQKHTGDSLFSNTALASAELIEMQVIADAFIEKELKKKQTYDYAKLHGLWVQMILKGYNIPAELIYDKLLTYKEFSLDYRKDNGLSALMASALSVQYGGNVEYAQRLVLRGADPSVLIQINGDNPNEPIMVNLIQLALQRDNYKVVALFIKSGVNYAMMPGSTEALILSEAVAQKAYKSAYVIKEALKAALAEPSNAVR